MMIPRLRETHRNVEHRQIMRLSELTLPNGFRGRSLAGTSEVLTSTRFRCQRPPLPPCPAPYQREMTRGDVRCVLDPSEHKKSPQLKKYPHWADVHVCSIRCSPYPGTLTQRAIPSRCPLPSRLPGSGRLTASPRICLETSELVAAFTRPPRAPSATGFGGTSSWTILRLNLGATFS